MEVASDDHVKVCGKMHLLISGHFETKDDLYQTIEIVSRNFTSIYDLAIVLLEDRLSKSKTYEFYYLAIRWVGSFITFCKCFSLKRILEEDGITINVSLARLLADIELYLLQHIKDSTVKSIEENLSLWFPDMALLKRICKAYLKLSPIYCCYQLIISYDLIIDFLDHCVDCLNRSIYYIPNKKTLKKHFIFLRNYLELFIHYNDLDKLLTAVENVTYKMARYIFFHEYGSDLELFIHYNDLDKLLTAVENVTCKMARYIFFHEYGSDLRKDILSEYGSDLRKDILKVFLSSTAPIMSDDLVVEYVSYVQDNLLELLQKNDTIDLKSTFKSQLWILHEGISFLMHLLVKNPPKHNSYQEKFLDIRLDFQALARNVGSVIISCLDGSMKEESSLGLYDLIQNIDVITGEIIKTICCVVLRETEREPPKKDQLGSLIILLRDLKEFMDSKPGSIITWKDHENLVLFIFYLFQTSIRGGDCTGDDKFSQYTIQLDVAVINHKELNGVLISAQVDAFNMACESMLRRYGKLCWWKLYLRNKERVDMHTCVGILKAIVLSSTTPLTDELLIAYGECVQDSLIELLSYDAFDPPKDQLYILHQGISFLVRLLINYMDEQQKLSHIKAVFQELVRSVGSVICSSFNNRANGETTMQRSTTELSKLVERMNLIIGEIEKFIHLVHINKIRLESPKTNQLGSMNLLLENWKELMEGESDLIITWKEKFQMIYGNLVLFKSFIASSSSCDDGSQNLCSSIVDAGHMAEYLLSTFYVGTCPVQCTSLWISEFMKYVKPLTADVMEVNKKKQNMKEISNTRKEQSHVSVQALLVPSSTDVVVGFGVEMKRIRDRLTGNPKQLDVISIIGMPGLGKTTLARKTYEDRNTINHFDVRAWCSVSQEYNKKDLLLTILGCISQLTDETRQKSEAKLSTMVHKELKGRRYFIVLDDIWHIDAYMGLKRFFPDDDNGSRILLTSRSKQIGLEAKFHSDSIEPGLLTEEQSWDLLQRKIYNNEKCPPELCLIGKEIAEKCKGLPLAVVVVGGVLKKSTQNRDFWEQVLRNLSSYLVRNSQSQFMTSLELSYEYLPDYLKPMFLYFGAFPEDMEIPAKKLTRLWMAEGFVQNTDSTSLESQAETNLMDLIDRSLVMVAKRRWDGRVKTCNVHDLLRDMCLAKAKEEKFMQQIHVHNEFPEPVMLYQRRLSIILKRIDDETTSRHLVTYTDLPKFSITPPIYSLLFFHEGSNYFSSPKGKGIEPVISSLKLLKVFDAEIFEITQDVLDKDLTMLVYLRYASFTTLLDSIPSAISRLRRLETLIIKNLSDGCIVVPETIWEMTKLRHLHINDYGKFSATSESSFILDNLQTLSTLMVEEYGEAEKIFRKVPALKKLSCNFQQFDRYEYQQFPLPNFESLGKLESLTCLFETFGQKVTGQLKVPLTLKKLSILRLELEWSQISMLKTLPNLEALILTGESVVDEYWDMGDDDVFTNLKFLKLESLNIERWSASSVNFPNLEKLVLGSCPSLVEISSELGEINTLQKIEVILCSSSLEQLVKEIQKEQEENGNESLEFYFFGNHGDW